MGIDYRQVALLFLISGLITFFVYKKTKSKGMALLAFIASFIVTYMLIHKYYHEISKWLTPKHVMTAQELQQHQINSIS